MRTLGTIVVIILAGLPALFAGWPSAAPAWFDDLLGGAPLSIIVMSALLLAFAGLAGLCSAAAKAAGRGEG